MAFDIERYRLLIDSFRSLMTENEGICAIRPTSDKWTLREMVGHLIDSASNNHQRFVRLQLVSSLQLPGYEAEAWKDVSRVELFDYAALVSFWASYNDFLLHLIRNMDEGSLSHYWEINGERKTLAFLVEDYFSHLVWHKKLFLDRVAEIKHA